MSSFPLFKRLLSEPLDKRLQFRILFGLDRLHESLDFFQNLDVMRDVSTKRLQIEVFRAIRRGHVPQLREQIDFFIAIGFVQQRLSILSGRYEAIVESFQEGIVYSSGVAESSPEKRKRWTRIS